MPFASDPLGAVIAVAVGTAYGLLVRTRRRRGSPWPRWRTGMYAVGVGALLLASGLPRPRAAGRLWVDALALGLVLAVAPMFLALGDPLRLYESARGRPLRWTRSRPARLVLFPVVGSFVSAAVVLWCLAGGWWDASLTSPVARAGLEVVLLGVGLLVCLPLLTDELLPTWCGHGLRVLLAAVDGLVDAVPGLVLMTWMTVFATGYARHEQQLAGGVFLAVAESVAIPMLVAVVAEWVRDEDRVAARVDAELDAQPDTGAPWWLDDPRFSGGPYATRRPAPPDVTPGEHPPPPEGRRTGSL